MTDDHRSTARARPAGALVAVALAAALPGCAFAVEHPAVTAGTVAGTLALGTCKLASDNIGGCLAVSGGAGVFLALVAATAIWLGGDGHSVAVEDPEVENPLEPLPAEDPPRERPPDPTDQTGMPPGSTPSSLPGAPSAPPPDAPHAPPSGTPPTTPPPSAPPTALPPGASPSVPPGASPPSTPPAQPSPAAPPMR